VAGVLSLADAAKVVSARGRLMAGLPDGGAMVAVGAGEAEVAPLLTDGVAIAAVNGPEAVVISGAEAAVSAIAQTLAHQGRRSHRLAVSHAFHSPLMEPMIDEFAAVVAEISPKEPRIPLVSNVSGQLAGAGYGSERYWVEHVRCPVRFAEGVRTAESSGGHVFVEVGPGGGLGAAVEQSLITEQPVTTITLAKDGPEAESLLTAAGRLFTIGIPVNWGAALKRGQQVPLPTYGFVRQRYWLGARVDHPSPAVARPAELAQRLRQLPPHEQRRELVQLVCLRAAAVLGYSESDAVNSERAFQDLGFDSLTGVELRNRLKADTGLPLSRTLIFDYPNPAALVDHLAQELLGGDSEDSDEERIWSALRKIPLHELRRTGLLDKLLLLAGEPEKSLTDSTVTDDTIDSLSPDALIALALDAGEGNNVQR
jgi:acyl transferase domain-containing protein